jgi:putative ABC transport system ATP-binding protein
MSSFISLEKVTKRYKIGANMVEVLYEESLTIERGEFVALMGPSGSGKTTLLNIIGGLDQVERGQVHVAGGSLHTLSNRKLSQWRAQNVGLVFQFYHLLPMLSVERNIMLPLLLTGLSASECRSRIRKTLELLGMAEYANRRPEELSGGQQQRVAIARALVTDPALLICDEPTGDLDRENADLVLQLLMQLNRDHGKTIVMATHDLQAAKYATRVIRVGKARERDEAGAKRSLA